MKPEIAIGFSPPPPPGRLAGAGRFALGGVPTPAAGVLV